MSISGIRIGFVPMSDSLRHPFDLRNFIYYSRKRNLSFEIADPEKDYDLIVLSPRADISIWSRFKGKAKMIYFLADSYLALSPYDLKGALRGLAKYVGGEHKYLKLNYSRAVRQMCKRANAVVCTTVEQKKDITPYCAHVHVILDFQFDIIREVKTEYPQSKRINLVWEGQAENINGFMQLREPLEELASKYPITLHLITDLERKKYMNLYRNVSVIDEIKRIFGPRFIANTVSGKGSMVYLYQWNLEMLSRIISGCDIALIPLDINNPLQRGKPENKLLLFWRMGVAAVVSDTPAYRGVMQHCGQELYCRTPGDWIQKLEPLINDHKKRQAAAERGKAYAESAYSESAYLKQWDRLFESVLSE
jgi:hypothetical protein